MVKVLTVKQPWASLIAYNYKHYEFRSWKTNYRGYVYIHAGLTLEKVYKDLINKFDLNIIKGSITAKAKIVDCILVDKTMNEKLYKENKLVYGHDHVGLYAWVLDDITLLKDPIEVKGKLGLWNYDIMGEVKQDE